MYEKIKLFENVRVHAQATMIPKNKELFILIILFNLQKNITEHMPSKVNQDVNT